MKKVLLVFLLCLLGQAAVAQQAAPAKTPVKLTLFYEKPYLHTDRETYTAGEAIWFKAYLVNARTNQLLDISKNLYVEFVSPNADILHRITVRLDGGTGAGDFQLADSIPSGSYRLRTYTTWMRNFGENFVFEKDIRIHSLHNATAETIALANSATKKPSQEHSVINPDIRTVPAAEVQFFPEGGALVTGVTSMVAFKGADSKGAGVVVSGSVYTLGGDTLSRFESSVLGIGAFVLTPEPGKRYFVKGKLANKQPYQVALPEVLAKGFVLRATELDSATLQFDVSTNVPTLQEQQNAEMLLVGRRGNERKLTVPFQLDALRKSFKVAKNLLPPSVVVITLYDAEIRPHCERLVYIPYPEPTTVILTPDKATYAPKSKVTIKIKAQQQEGVGVKANLSVVAVDAGVIPVNEINIVAYLMLQSEVQGKIDQPEQYFDKMNKNKNRQLDLLLLTQGWRDFIWKRIADTTVVVKYLPEQGFTVSGRLRQQYHNKPLLDANINLTAFKAQGQKLFSSKPDPEGKFYFDGLQLYGRQSISVNSINKKGGGAGILALDSLLLPPLPLKSLLFGPTTETYVKAPEEFLKRNATLARYRLSDTIMLKGVVVEANKPVVVRDETGGIKSGLPDRVYNIGKNEKEFGTLRQFINYHIPEDHRQDGNVRFFVNNTELGQAAAFAPEDGSMEGSLEAGQIADEREAVYNIRMEKVQKVVLRQLVNVFNENKYVLFITATPDAFVKKELNRAILNVDGYYQARTFYSPRYDTRDNPGQTDLRTTIYWQHTLQTDENGEASFTFFNADPTSSIRVVAEGITERGEPVVGAVVYEVK